MAALAILGRVPAGVWVGLVAVAVVAGVGWWSYRAGYDAHRAETLQRSVEVLRERKSIDEAVSDLDAADLCRELGGVWDNGKCL